MACRLQAVSKGHNLSLQPFQYDIKLLTFDCGLSHKANGKRNVHSMANSLRTPAMSFVVEGVATQQRPSSTQGCTLNLPSKLTYDSTPYVCESYRDRYLQTTSNYLDSIEAELRIGSLGTPKIRRRQTRGRKRPTPGFTPSAACDP